MPTSTTPESRPPRDVHEAVDALLLASARADDEDWAATIDPHLAVLAQRFGEARPIPGMAAGSARWAVVQRFFDDVARVTEVDARHQRLDLPDGGAARFADLPDATQQALVSGLAGVMAQMSTIALSKAPR